MRQLIYILPVLMAAACMKDGAIITAAIEGDNQMNISSANDNIVLGNDQGSTLVLTLYWNGLGQVSLDNPNVSMPEGILAYTLQFSADETFTTIYEHPVDSDAMSAQFTGGELNTILSKLEYPGGTPLPLHIRMKMQFGANNEPQYGEPMSITVTAFAIDMSTLQLVSKDMTTVAGTISATDVKGEYAGFVSVDSWYNFYFVEGDGTVWGNDGVSGTPFLTSNDAVTFWNCWFPAPKGFYYVTLSTNDKEWTALSIPTVHADVEGNIIDMTYSAELNCWSAVFTTAADNVPVGLNQSGTYYDHTTGDSAGNEQTFSFKAAADGTFVKAEASEESGITTGEPGTYTLILYCTEMQWELAEGEKQIGPGNDSSFHEDPDYVEAVSDILYIYASDSHKTKGEVVAKLLPADGIYQGFFCFTGYYNFLFGDTDDPSTARFYGSSPHDGLYRLYCSSDMYSIWFDQDATMYTRVSVDMKARSWKYEEIESIHIVGDFNDWAIDNTKSLPPAPMEFDSETKTWSATITPDDWKTYGIKFLINTDWGWCLTDADKDGCLEAGITEFIPDVPAGKTYKVTIDLNDPEAMTYKFEEIK